MQDIIVDRLRREFNVTCEVGAPQVNYRESISRLADIHYTHKKQSGGAGQYADIYVKFEPGEPQSGFTFRSEIKGGAVRPCLRMCRSATAASYHGDIQHMQAGAGWHFWGGCNMPGRLACTVPHMFAQQAVRTA